MASGLGESLLFGKSISDQLTLGHRKGIARVIQVPN